VVTASAGTRMTATSMFAVFVPAEQVMSSVSRFLTTQLRLTVNETKSTVPATRGWAAPFQRTAPPWRVAVANSGCGRFTDGLLADVRTPGGPSGPAQPATTTLIHSASHDSTFRPRLNPVEPPSYETRMPGGVGGVTSRHVPPIPINAQATARMVRLGPDCGLELAAGPQSLADDRCSRSGRRSAEGRRSGPPMWGSSSLKRPGRIG
jgi:hypothetical protein